MEEEKNNISDISLTFDSDEGVEEAHKKLVEIDQVIDMDSLEPNSVIILRIGGGMEHKIQMHKAFVRFIQSKGDLFKEKKHTILFLEPGDSLEVLSEEDMENAGWTKKEKSLIVKPY